MTLITAASPTIVGTRVYPLYVDQAPTYPCINYERVSTTREHGMSGPHGRASARFRCHCWGATYAVAKATANSLRTLLDGFSGKVSGVDIGWIRTDGENDDFADAPEVYRTILDFLVSHKE